MLWTKYIKPVPKTEKNAAFIVYLALYSNPTYFRDTDSNFPFCELILEKEGFFSLSHLVFFYYSIFLLEGDCPPKVGKKLA